MATLQLTPDRGFTLSPDQLAEIARQNNARMLQMGQTPDAGAVSIAGGGTPSLDSSSMMGASPDAPGGTPQGGNPYQIFSQNLMELLNRAQKIGDPTALLKSREQLTNQSLNLSNPMNDTPYKSLFGMMTPGQSIANQKGTEGAFEPGLSSITDQMNAANAGLKTFNDTIQNVHDITKPLEAPQGVSYVDPMTGKTIYQGGKFTPSFNYQKGIMDGFDSSTGSWASDMQGGGGSGASNQLSLIGGIDLSGAATSTKPYATDPNYTTEVSGIYNTLKQTIPNADSASIDQYIKGHAKNSPVTGQMIINAANQYGVDPLSLTAVLAHESDFGTAGAATSTMNAGNVGNTGTSTKTFNSWQAGVSSAAYELAKRMPGNKNATNATPGQSGTSNVGGQFSDEATQKISQLPSWMQSYTDAGPKGVAYINDTKVPQIQKDAVKNFAAKVGVPYFDAADVQAVKSLMTVYNSLDNMQAMISQTLRGGAMGVNASWAGHLEDLIRNPLSEMLQTDKGVSLSQFSSYRDTAIKTVQGLAGGAGSGLRINGAEIIANVSTLPTHTDSLQTGLTKINSVRQKLDTQLSATFPYIGGNQPAQDAGGLNQTSQSILDKYGIK